MEIDPLAAGAAVSPEIHISASPEPDWNPMLSVSGLHCTSPELLPTIFAAKKSPGWEAVKPYYDPAAFTAIKAAYDKISKLDGITQDQKNGYLEFFRLVGIRMRGKEADQVLSSKRLTPEVIKEMKLIEAAENQIKVIVEVGLGLCSGRVL